MQLRRVLPVLQFAALLDMIAASVLWTIMPVYLVQVLKLSTTSAGLVTSIYGVAQFFSSPLAGSAADRFGVKQTLLCCLLACVPSYAALAIPLLPVFIAGRVGAGLFKHTQNLIKAVIASYGRSADGRSPSLPDVVVGPPRQTLERLTEENSFQISNFSNVHEPVRSEVMMSPAGTDESRKSDGQFSKNAQNCDNLSNSEAPALGESEDLSSAVQSSNFSNADPDLKFSNAEPDLTFSIADQDSNTRRQTEAFGKTNAMGYVGFFVGPIIGGHVASLTNGYALGYGITAGCFLANFIILKLAYSDRQDVSPLPTTVKSGGGGSVKLLGNCDIFHRYWDIVIIRFCMSLAPLIVRATFAWFYMERLSLSNQSIGYLMSFQNVIAFLSSYFAHAITARFSSSRVACAFFICVAMCGLLCMILAHSIPSSLVGLGVLQVGNALLRTISYDLTYERAGYKEIGLLTGFFASVTASARAVSPAIGGYLHEFSINLPFLAALVVYGISMLVCLVCTAGGEKGNRVSSV